MELLNVCIEVLKLNVYKRGWTQVVDKTEILMFLSLYLKETYLLKTNWKFKIVLGNHEINFIWKKSDTFNGLTMHENIYAKMIQEETLSHLAKSNNYRNI